MASKYSKSFTIPPETAAVLTDLTRELLRASTYGNDINETVDLYAFCFT